MKCYIQRNKGSVVAPRVAWKVNLMKNKKQTNNAQKDKCNKVNFQYLCHLKGHEAKWMSKFKFNVSKFGINSHSSNSQEYLRLVDTTARREALSVSIVKVLFTQCTLWEPGTNQMLTGRLGSPEDGAPDTQLWEAASVS